MTDRKKTIRILVFGSTGTGKTSLCNTLSGEKQPVSSSAQGVTFKSHTFEAFDYNDLEIILTDTVGLNESKGSKIPPAEAISNLIQLLKNSQKGYNLIIQVMRMPRITNNVTSNYDFFYNTICQKKIPIILAVTGCENEDPMSIWVDENKNIFEYKELIYEDIIATCFHSGGRFEKIYSILRDESKENLLKSIENSVSPVSIKLYKDKFYLIKLFRKAWDKFCDFANLNWHSKIRKKILDMLMQLGLSKEDAQKKADEL